MGKENLNFLTYLICFKNIETPDSPPLTTSECVHNCLTEQTQKTVDELIGTMGNNIFSKNI